MLPGFEVIDIKDYFKKETIEVYLKKSNNPEVFPICSRCKNFLESYNSSYPVRIQTMPILNFKTYLCFKRHKYYCPHCKKVRVEDLEFISPETPHLTQEYAWWLARMCEMASVKKVAEFTGHDNMTLWRLDFARLKRMFQYYKIPKVTKITVDEVYARSKKYHPKESRDRRFFTIVCDMETRRVIWVSESRDKKALDEFFNIIGPERCREIEVVAMDQHDGYRLSVKENCPRASVVWDKFHIMQSFENALNEERKLIHEKSPRKSDIKYLACGTFKYLFLKKAKDRSDKETRHFKQVARENEDFYYLELIKERMLQLFYERSPEEAALVLLEIVDWIKTCEFKFLHNWMDNFMNNWNTIRNYFKYRVTSALSEGQNNVIKVLKRRGYGYRNMQYFQLKILQVCGFLNSKFVPMNFQGVQHF